MRRDIEKSAAITTRPETSSDLAAISGLRGIIANRLSASWNERPQVTLTTDADASALVTPAPTNPGRMGLEVVL